MSVKSGMSTIAAGERADDDDAALLRGRGDVGERRSRRRRARWSRPPRRRPRRSPRPARPGRGATGPGRRGPGRARAAWSSFVSVRAVPVTVQPSAFASWTTAVPTPDPTACTSTCSPVCRPPRVRSASWAVMKTSGIPPASTRSTCVGDPGAVALVHDERLGLRAAADDPEDPVADRDACHARSERGDLPENSMPGMSAGTPGGAG